MYCFVIRFVIPDTGDCKLFEGLNYRFCCSYLIILSILLLVCNSSAKAIHVKVFIHFFCDLQILYFQLQLCKYYNLFDNMQLLQNDLSIKISIPSTVNMNTYLFIILFIEIIQH